MAQLSTDVRYIKGIGETRAKALEKLEIRTLRDLVCYFPRAYEDRTRLYTVRDLPLGESACVRAMVASEPEARRIGGGRVLVKLRAVDETGTLDVTFFNQAYRRDSLHTGETYLFFGKVEGNLLRRRMTNPLLEREGQQLLTGRIMPVYPLTAGISQPLLCRAVRQGLDECRDLWEDVLPEDLRMAHRLCYVNYAYENIHFPATPEALDVARRRLVFEELFLLRCGLRLLRNRRRGVAGPLCKARDMAAFYEALPFSLTGAQRRAIEDAAADMAGDRPMNRLCQGDVGSGKTMVAAACIWFAAQNGWQSAMMAPTEILARQHFENLSPLFERFGLRCALLTGSTRAADRREILAGLQSGRIHVAIGTHALLSEDVIYGNLGLVVTDEQHRFGVNQRAALGKKAENPHMLVLSATPIPRTLALVIYGDLDVSVIYELPPGRQKVDTFAVNESYRQRINAFLRKQAAQGHQVFVVCPLVGEGDVLPDERKAATAYAEKLRTEVFPDLRIALLHGKMKPREKEAVMASFAAGESDILVSTTVIEVGVDVPNATVMLVENAERFGLSQLHQLRGRVGRGGAKSYCILISDSDSEETRRRLKVMTATNDGFRIAEEDLKLRGPGDFFGKRQHGLPCLQVADLSCDMRLLDEAQRAAQELMASDPGLAQPSHEPLRRRIHELFALHGEGMN
ncbi:MAG: ATP-dependent DNA helicase RecG [Oscillospiraceae bacterium]|nr:ATP-dependent DNA helicase RecG [Oscillospiraceae bacterium]